MKPREGGQVSPTSTRSMTAERPIVDEICIDCGNGTQSSQLAPQVGIVGRANSLSEVFSLVERCLAPTRGARSGHLDRQPAVQRVLATRRFKFNLQSKLAT